MMIFDGNGPLSKLGHAFLRIATWTSLLASAACATAAAPVNPAKPPIPSSCAAELNAMRSSHAVARTAIGAVTTSRVDAAARAHGRQILLWYADLLGEFTTAKKDLHPARLAFLQSSSTFLRCRYGALSSLPEWNPARDQSAVPADWALPGDLLVTDGGCGVFLRGEVAGLPGHGMSGDRMAWTWTGSCPGGMANGIGQARVILRSGEVREGLLGNGFAQSSFRRGRMDGLFQATDGSRESPDWRNHFDRYANGRLIQRLQRHEGGDLVEVQYRMRDGAWGWAKAANGR